MRTREEQAAIDLFFETVIKRESIFVRKELLKWDRPYTEDVVFDSYRFCNVHRCYDATSRLIRKYNLKGGVRVMFRWLASRPMLEEIGNDGEYAGAVNLAMLGGEGAVERLVDFTLEKYRGGVPLVTGSFIVKRNKNDREYLLNRIVQGDKLDMLVRGGITLRGAVSWIKVNMIDMGDFSAYCVMTDYIYDGVKFEDIDTYCPFGPGAVNGQKVIYGNKYDTQRYLDNCRALLLEWRRKAEYLCERVSRDCNLGLDVIDKMCVDEGLPAMTFLIKNASLLEIEHWLCEFAKYVRGNSRNVYRRDGALFVRSNAKKPLAKRAAGRKPLLDEQGKRIRQPKVALYTADGVPFTRGRGRPRKDFVMPKLYTKEELQNVGKDN